MPRYEPDLTKVAATFELFTKGQYEFVIGEPKCFQDITKSGPRAGETKIGIRFPIVLAEETAGHKKGARQMYTVYIHSEAAQAFGKQFVMAALGYERNSRGEKAFDE